MKKKVKNCTIKEIEKYFTNIIGYIPDVIQIFWYDVRLCDIDGNVITSILKEQEIEVKDND